MNEAVTLHRIHFASTVTFHYVFPQLTIGLALLILYLKIKALRTGDEHYNTRFWVRIFGSNFALGGSPESRWNSNLKPTGQNFYDFGFSKCLPNKQPLGLAGEAGR